MGKQIDNKTWNKLCNFKGGYMSYTYVARVCAGYDNMPLIEEFHFDMQDNRNQFITYCDTLGVPVVQSLRINASSNKESSLYTYRVCPSCSDCPYTSVTNHKSGGKTTEGITNLDDAIQYTTEKSVDPKCSHECKDEHRRLAEWLKELKQRRERDNSRILFQGRGRVDGVDNNKIFATIFEDDDTVSKEKIRKVIMGIDMFAPPQRRQVRQGCWFKIKQFKQSNNEIKIMTELTGEVTGIPMTDAEYEPIEKVLSDPR